MTKGELVKILSGFADDLKVKIVHENVLERYEDNLPKLVGYSEFLPQSIEGSALGITNRVDRT